MEVRRAVPVTHEVTASVAALLHGTINTFRGAARYVDVTHLRSSHKPSDGDAPVGVRINAGAMTESGFVPAPGLVRSGVHGESPPA